MDILRSSILENPASCSYRETKNHILYRMHPTEEEANVFTKKTTTIILNDCIFVYVNAHRAAVSRHADLAERARALARPCVEIDQVCGFG